MGEYIARRFLFMLFMLLLTTATSFIIITLPPGDFMTTYMATLAAQGVQVSEGEIQALRKAYGLDQPEYIQYFIWMKKMLFEGDLGRSLDMRRPVVDLIMERVGPTLIVSLGATVMAYMLAIPIGIYSATRQYSFGDYLFTVIGFIGLAVPNFILGLVVMVFFYNVFGVPVGGLFSSGMEDAPWSLGKAADLLSHLPVAWIVVGLAGMASIIRIMRATLLDELNRPYVETARAKSLPEWKVLLKYPVRIALNPIASTAAWMVPFMFSGMTITSIVLNLPTIGPMQYQALLSQDMYLAGATVMITIALTVIGVFISDLILVWLDPRIRFEH